MKTPWFIVLTCLSATLAAAAEASVEGSVMLDQARPHPTAPGYKPQTVKPIEKPEAFGAIVYLENATGIYPKPGSGIIQIEQKGYQFRPAITAVQTGSRVMFPNMDDEFHNVFSYSKTKRFDLGRFRKDEESPAIYFDKPGVVKIYCEIHQHMRCILLVVDTPWFAKTDEKGRFKIPRVSPGSYTLRAFLPSEKVLSMPVTVPASGTIKVELKR